MEYDAAVTQRQSLFALLAQVAVAVLALVGATVLCAMDKIDGAALTALYGTAIAASAAAATTTAQRAINGGPQPNLDKLAASSNEASVLLAEKHAQNPPSTSSH